MSPTRRVYQALACWLLLASGCKDDVVPATEVVVTINSDLDVGKQLSRIDVHVYDVGGHKLSDERQFDLSATPPLDGEVRLPFSFAIAKGKATRFRLEVLGYGPLGTGGAQRQVIERSLIVSFRDRETILVKVFLGELCFGLDRTCPDGRTCYSQAEAGTKAGECGTVSEAPAHVLKPGDESKAWTGQLDSGASNRDAGMDAGHAHDAGSDAGKTVHDAGHVADSGTDSGAGSHADSGGTGGSGSGGTGGSGTDAGATPACTPVEHQYAPPPADHIDAAVFVPNSNPPSGGQHCDAWGEWGDTFTQAVPLEPCYFVHNLEHHGIVLLYNCAAACPDIVDSMHQVMSEIPGDPDCDFKRVVLTPYPELNAKVGASIWGYTWTADCFDSSAQDSLLDFIRRHWVLENEAPEPHYCGMGSVTP